MKEPEWWLANIQNDLYSIIYEYMKTHNLKKADIAQKLGVTKGYISQILKGDFDHKMSKFVELALSFNKAPLIFYVDMERYIKDDAQKKAYELYPVIKPGKITFEVTQSPEPQPVQKNRIETVLSK